MVEVKTKDLRRFASMPMTSPTSAAPTQRRWKCTPAPSPASPIRLQCSIIQMLHIQGFLSIVSALPEAIGRISSKNTKGIHHTAEKWPRPFPDQELFAIPHTCSFTFTIGCIFPLVRRHGTCEHDRTLTLVLWTLRYVLLNMSISPVAVHYI